MLPSNVQAVTLNGIPPTVNSIYFNAKAGGRRKTKAYKNWIKDASWQLAAQHPDMVRGEVEFSLFCKRPDNKRRDIDNLFKASLDLLVSNNLIEDDSKVVKISGEWTKHPEIDGTLILWGPHR